MIRREKEEKESVDRDSQRDGRSGTVIHINYYITTRAIELQTTRFVVYITFVFYYYDIDCQFVLRRSAWIM